MKVESITFLSDLKDVRDIFDDNVDVAVKLDDGHEYIVVVATQKNLLTLMNNEKSDLYCWHGSKRCLHYWFYAQENGTGNLFLKLGAQKVKREAGGLWITQLTQDNSFYPGQRTDHDISRQNFWHETKFGFLSYHHGHFVLPR